MDVRQLRYFVAVADERHFGRAAEKLHIAQPALSQQIRSLETQLGLRLFERTSRGVVLTDAGSRLLDEARGVLARFDDAVETMRRVKEGELGVLRVGVFPGPLREFLPPVLAELRRQLPEVDVETRSIPTDEQVGALLDARLDLALLPSLRQLELPEPLVGEVISREPLGIAVPAAHPLARQRELSGPEVTALPLVFMARDAAPDVYDTVLATLRAVGAQPRSLLESSTPESSVAIVAAGLAVSVKTRSEVEAADGVVWRLLAGFGLELSIVAAFDPRRMTPPLRLLVDLLAHKRTLSPQTETVLDAAEAGRSTPGVTETGGRDGI
jgi:DNA-binding transcriptional LysR family regulator